MGDAHKINLYQHHIVMMRQRAMRLLGDEQLAEKIAEEAFRKTLESGLAIGDGYAIAASFYRITTNLALNELRSHQRRRDVHYAANQTVEQHDRDAMWREVLSALSYDEAQVGSYAYVDGLQPGEIAKLLHIELRTVDQRLQAFERRAERYLHLLLGHRHVA